MDKWIARTITYAQSEEDYAKLMAEAYHDPSLIICYAPCINHGIKIGMGRTQNEEKKAVECGYSLFSASLSKSHWLFFTSGTITPPRKRPARMSSISTRRSPTGASSATSLWTRSATTP